MKHEAEVLADQDPEALHQMRVGLRRLRTAMEAFGFALELPPAVSLSHLRKFAQGLGAVRDLDVLRAELEAQELPELEKAALKPVLKAMHKQRSRVFKQLKKMLHSKSYRKFKQSLETWLERPQYGAIAKLPLLPVLPDLLLPQVSQILLHPAWLISTAPSMAVVLQEHGFTLHDLRKQMKRIRYQTELFVDHYNEAFAAQVEEFKQMQEILGRIQDSAVLHEYLANRLNLEKDCPQLTQVLDDKVSVAWLQWRSRATNYLNPHFRRDLRQRMLECH
jgi:CHAD domain-containing protein